MQPGNANDNTSTSNRPSGSNTNSSSNRPFADLLAEAYRTAVFTYRTTINEHPVNNDAFATAYYEAVVDLDPSGLALEFAEAELIANLLRDPQPSQPYSDSDFALRYALFAQTRRSDIGIAQALVEHFWNTTIDQLPTELGDILREVGDEFQLIPESGFDDNGDSIHRQQLQEYEDALFYFAHRPNQFPLVHPLLAEVYRRQDPYESIQAFFDLRRIVEQEGEDRQTALLIFRLVHHRARIGYRRDRENDPLDDDESVGSSSLHHL